MQSVSVYILFAFGALLGLCGITKAEFTKKKVASIRLNRSLETEYDEKHGFQFRANKAICAAAAERVDLIFDEEDGQFGSIGTYEVTHLGSDDVTVTRNLVPCFCQNDSVCYVKKKKENSNSYQVFIEQQPKMGPYRQCDFQRGPTAV